VTRLCLSQPLRGMVAIVTSGRSRGFSDWPAYRRRLSSTGIHHFTIDLFDRDPAVFWRSVAALSVAIRKFRPRIVHRHAGVPACAAAISRHATGMELSLLSQFHSWGIARPNWMNTMDLWGFGQSDHMVCASRSYRKILIDGGIPRKRIDYIPWGLPVEEIRRSATRPGRCEARGPHLGFVGRIEPRKGQADLVRAFARYCRRKPGALLSLVGPVGDEDYAQTVKALIRNSGLEHSVILTGKVADVFRHISGWDLFVSMSQDEGQGIAILEAMALGVPVIARGVPGVEDYLKQGYNGLALEYGAPAEAAKMIGWALEHPQRLERMAERARLMIERNYRWDDMLRRFDALYDRLRAPGMDNL